MINLRNLSIAKRLTLGFGTIGAALLITAGVALQGIRLLDRGIQATKAEASHTALTLGLMNNLSNINFAIVQLMDESTEAGRQARLDAIEGMRAQYKEQMAALKAGADAEDRTYLEGIEAALGSGKQVNAQVVNLARTGHGAEASQIYLHKGVEIKAVADRACQAFLDHRTAQAAKVEARLNATQAQARWVITLATLAGLGLASWIGWLITRIYLADMGAITAYTKTLAGGDLSRPFRQDYQERRDEFGAFARDYKLMVENMRRLIKELGEGVRTVASSATELSAASEEMAATTSTLAQNTSSQRAGAEAMAATIEELSASIQAVSHSAQDAIAVMEEALDATREGDSAGAATRTAMAGVIASAQQISAATQVIGEMANQTNLLSLNAAIEAAKAGAHGKGFAVVAEEVRKLAERSASSAKQINSLIQSAHKATEEGSATVSATVQLLGRIRDSLGRFADRTRQITSATVEQSQASQEVAHRVGTTVQEAAASAAATSQMAATTGEIARTAADLAKVAEHLRVQVEAFTL